MKSRLVGLDCLRGLAAMVVVLVHYSTRFKELYPDIPTIPWTAPSSYAAYAVQLFFVISGFVIFMTIERMESPTDFIKARFFRLYPPFWATATFTFVLLLLFDLPGREVSPLTYIVNLTMIPKALSPQTMSFTYVDGAYWTLEREFFFYVIMVIVLALHAKKSIHWIVLALLMWNYIFPHIPFSSNFWKWKVQLVTLVGYIKYFALGISLYCIARKKNQWVYVGLTSLLFAMSLAIEGKMATMVFVTIGGLVYASTYVEKIPRLLSPLSFLGTISYSLYLVHQNLGYVILKELGRRHINTYFAFAVAIGCSILIATTFCYGVEKPVMAWRKRQSK